MMLSKEGSTVIDLDGVTYDLPIRGFKKDYWKENDEI